MDSQKLQKTYFISTLHILSVATKFVFGNLSEKTSSGLLFSIQGFITGKTQ